MRVPWLYDGVPDHPAWLRRRVLGASGRQRRQLRRMAKEGGFAYNPREERARRWRVRANRVRRHAYDLLTAPAVTFSLALVGGPIVALQLDRLTDNERGGTWWLLVLGIALVILGAWLARTRTIVEERSRDGFNDEMLKGYFRRLDERLDGNLSDVERQQDGAYEDLQAIRRLLEDRASDRP